tara:strand:- start:1418 stop:1561 length:144 start_codon:yes stop_codon:yes gene_type:complete
MEIEKLDVKNILEVQRMREILKAHPDLIALFEIMMKIINNTLNDDHI